VAKKDDSDAEEDKKNIKSLGKAFANGSTCRAGCMHDYFDDHHSSDSSSCFEFSDDCCYHSDCGGCKRCKLDSEDICDFDPEIEDCTLD